MSAVILYYHPGGYCCRRQLNLDREVVPTTCKIGGKTALAGMLAGLKIALVGGDEREVILCQALLHEEARVILAGFPERADLAGAAHMPLMAAVVAADAVVAPLNGVDESGRIKAQMDKEAEPLRLTGETLAAMAGKPLLIGSARPWLQQLADRYGIRIVETAAIDEIAILNSIPTAEGAILRAMTELPITIHGSRSIVVGFGRCGITLARMLHGLGAHVVVAARNPAQLARAFEMGFSTAPLSALAEAAATADCLYNTVPFLVVTAEIIASMPATALIIDIASAPGGVDFAAAKERGIKAFLDLGIPGRVAPRTAGLILARTIPRLLAEACR